MTSTTKYLALSILPLAALALVACGDDSDAEPSPAPTFADVPVDRVNCGYDDMLAFELIEDSFDLPAGYVVCIHIDQARDTGVDN